MNNKIYDLTLNNKVYKIDYEKLLDCCCSFLQAKKRIGKYCLKVKTDNTDGIFNYDDICQSTRTGLNKYFKDILQEELIMDVGDIDPDSNINVTFEDNIENWYNFDNDFEDWVAKEFRSCS